MSQPIRTSLLHWYLPVVAGQLPTNTGQLPGAGKQLPAADSWLPRPLWTVRLSTRLPEFYFSGGARVLRDCASVCVPASSLLSPSPLLQSCHRRCSRHRHRYRKIPICLSRKKTPERRCVRRPRGSASEWLIRDRRSLRSGFRQIGRSYEHEFEWPTFQFEPTLPSPKKSVPCLTLGFISRSPNASALIAELRLRRLRSAARPP